MDAERKKKRKKGREEPAEIAVIGDVDDWEAEVIRDLLGAPRGGDVIFYIDSVGGSVYGALAALTLMKVRSMEGMAVVLGECSSASLLLFSACKKRLVTPHSTLLFHKMRWQSEKAVQAGEAVRWAQHFDGLEKDLDSLQYRLFGKAEEQVRQWIESGKYVTGPELAAAGLAELVSEAGERGEEQGPCRFCGIIQAHRKCGR